MSDKRMRPAPVIPIQGGKPKKPVITRKDVKESERKWGKEVMAQRFTVIPSLLLRAQARLGLDSRQLVALLHLIEHWWKAERMPYPSKKALAERMSLTPRQVQRCIAALEENGLVKRVKRSSPKGQMNNEYDLSGLVARLKAIEPEFRKAAEEAEARRRALERPRRGVALVAAE